MRTVHVSGDGLLQDRLSVACKEKACLKNPRTAQVHPYSRSANARFPDLAFALRLALRSAIAAHPWP